MEDRNTFNEAKQIMEKTCSEENKNRKRNPTGECGIFQFQLHINRKKFLHRFFLKYYLGYGWFSLSKLSYKTPKESCEIRKGTYERGDLCDIYIKVFMADEGEPSFSVPMVIDEASRDVFMEFRSDRMKKSTVRFEMWDGNNIDASLNLGDVQFISVTYYIKDIMGKEHHEMCENRYGNGEFCLSVYQIRWQDEYDTY